MKIHATQNLDLLSTNRYNSHSMYAEKPEEPSNYRLPGMKHDSVSFKGKKKLVDIVIDKFSKAADKEKLSDKILKSGFFDKILDSMSHEVAIQAAISLIVCSCLRPLTILAIPSKKSKEDNMYAAAHSVSSGIVGMVGAFLIATPFSKGIKYAQKNLIGNLKEEILEKRFPNLKLDSIWKDKAKGLRKPMDEWIDIYGNKFSDEFKNVVKVARPKPISTVSEKTLQSLGLDVDLAAMKGKPVSEWVDKKGNKIHLNLKDMFIAVEEEGMGQNFFSLQHIDKNFLKEVFPDLALESIEKEGKRLHSDLWKKVDGTPFDLDMNKVQVSSYIETADAVPLYTGLKRTEKEGGKSVEKYLAYQSNAKGNENGTVPEYLGSPVLQEYLDNAHLNEITDKLLGWMPDIITRPVVASATIALIPLILKKAFNLEKGKKEPAPEMNQNQNMNAIQEDKVEIRKAVA